MALNLWLRMVKFQMYYTDDPVADFARHDAEREAALECLPVCSECGEHIQDEYCFEINDEIICETCMVEHYRKFTTDLMG